MTRHEAITSILGNLLICMSLCMPIGLLFSRDGRDLLPLLLGAAITLGTGIALRAVTRFRPVPLREMRRREGYILAVLAWIVVPLFGALPFLIYGLSITDAYFEAMSGFTTTGATVIAKVSQLPQGLLFWRALTHWLGGLSILLLVLYALPLMETAGMHLMTAESTGMARDRIHPSLPGTAKRIWGIYAGLTVLLTLLLMVGEMNFFEAICHAFSTVSTGGFSTRDEGMLAFTSPYIRVVILIFMLLGGTNFALHYHAAKRRPGAYFRDEEFRFFVFVIIGAAIFLFAGMRLADNSDASALDVLFQVVSVVTTTGFAAGDYENWTYFASVFFFVLFFTGACLGSTTAGLKMARLLLLLKNGLAELSRLMHPRALIPVRMNGRMVAPVLMRNILAFYALYMLVFLLGAAVMSFTGLDIKSAMSSVAATLGGIGPGLGSVGPLQTYGAVSEFGKWFLSFLMMLGRLEILTVFIVFSPGFWKV